MYPVSEAWTIPQLNLPVQRITCSEMQTWSHAVDLEIPQVDSKDVTILLGGNVLEAILQREVRRGSPGQPAAVPTKFGWTLTGSVKSLVALESLHVMLIHTVPSDDDFCTDRCRTGRELIRLALSTSRRHRDPSRTREPSRPSKKL